MTGYEKALNAYQNTRESQMKGEEIYAELLKGLITNLYKAKDSYQDQDLERVVELNEKSGRIISALRTTLDFDKHPDASTYMNDLFTEITVRISKMLRADDVAAHCDETIEIIKPAYERWADFAKNGKLTANTEAP